MRVVDPEQIDLSVLQHIAGAEMVTKWFGFWPSFHDCEILRITMERQFGEEPCCYGYKVEFIVFDGSVEPSDKRRNNSLLTLFFKRPIKASIKGFNHQNAINGLWIWIENEKFLVEFCGFGADAAWECESVRVIDVSKYVGKVIGFENVSEL